MSKKIDVTYLPEPSPLGVIFRPKILIWISNDDKHSRIFHALVDSGSDRNLFPSGVAESIGVNVKSGRSRIIYGIGRVKLIAYEHQVNLHLGREIFKTNIDFSYEQNMPLLGRDGFFNLFKRVEFREYKKEIEFKL